MPRYTFLAEPTFGSALVSGLSPTVDVWEGVDGATAISAPTVLEAGTTGLYYIDVIPDTTILVQVDFGATVSNRYQRQVLRDGDYQLTKSRAIVLDDVGGAVLDAPGLASIRTEVLNTAGLNAITDAMLDKALPVSPTADTIGDSLVNAQSLFTLGENPAAELLAIACAVWSMAPTDCVDIAAGTFGRMLQVLAGIASSQNVIITADAYDGKNATAFTAKIYADAAAAATAAGGGADVPVDTVTLAVTYDGSKNYTRTVGTVAGL